MIKGDDRTTVETKGVGEEASKEKASGSSVLEVEAEGKTAGDVGEKDIATGEET